MTVRFHTVFDEALTEIGQVKSDPYRKSHKWTALDERGRRIKDCHTRDEAEDQIQMRAELLAEGWVYIPVQGKTVEEKRQEALDCILLDSQPFNERRERMIPAEGTPARAVWDKLMETP